MKLRDTVITSLLALSGAALWTHGAAKLAASGNFDYRPNLLGVKMSPYGQVIAMASQGGIESDWHGVESPGAEPCSSCGHTHYLGSVCSNTAKDETWIERLETAATEKTNPRQANAAHRFYLRRQIENKLQIAYELDPSNYTNYNAFHFFLTEPAIGTRPVMTDKVVQLAKATIDYCHRERNDPRPALTAAAASCNILQLLFLHQESHSVEEMREQLATLDASLSIHHELSAAWLDSGGYANLSVARQNEMLDRLSFCTKIRDAAEKTIARIARQGGEVSYDVR